MKSIKYILIILSFSILFLKAEEPQKILVEQFTTSHVNSPSFVPISNQFNNIVNSNVEVIPFTVHMNSNPDKFWEQYKQQYKRVFTYAKQNEEFSYPLFAVNGDTLGNINQLQSKIDEYKNKNTTYKLKVQEDRSSSSFIFVDVYVESDTMVSPDNQIMCLLVERHINDPSVRSPNENNFYYVVRDFELNENTGASIQLNKKLFYGYRFDFPIQDYFNLDEIYAIAWVQNRVSKEVKQTEEVDEYNEDPEILPEIDSIKFDDENQTDVQYFNILNPTMGYLDVENISLENDENFSIQFNPNENRIYPGQSKEIVVSFDGDEVGEYSTNLVVESNATNTPTLKVPVVANITQTSFAEIALSTETIDFGDVDTYAIDTFYVSNTGSGDLSISTVYFDDNYDGDFELLNQNFPDIKPGEDWEVVIKFQPSEEQAYFSLLNIESNANNDPAITIQVEGNGVDLTPHATSLLSTDSIDFGETSSEPKTRSLVITNIGNQELQVHNVQIDNNSGGVFSLVGETNLNIPGGEKDSLVVQFQPEAETEYNAILIARTNDTDFAKRRKEVSLNGKGTDIASVENKEILENYFDLKVYPNPATDEIKLNFGAFAGSVNLRISNLAGNLLRSLQFNISNNTTKSIKLIDLNVGSYIMEISDGNKSTSLKFNVVK